MPKLENHCDLPIQKCSTPFVRRNKLLYEQMVFVEFTFARLALTNREKLKDRNNKCYRRPNSRSTYALSKKPSHNVVHHGDKYTCRGEFKNTVGPRSLGCPALAIAAPLAALRASGDR